MKLTPCTVKRNGVCVVCVFITAVPTAVPITKLQSCSRCVCLFITAVPITKLFAGGGGVESGGHLLRETTKLKPRPPVRRLFVLLV